MYLQYLTVSGTELSITIWPTAVEETIGSEKETSDLDGHRSACPWGTGVPGSLIWFWGPYSYSPPRMCSCLVNLPHVLDTVVELGCASQCCRPSVLKHKARLKPISLPKVLPVFLGDSTYPMPCWHGGVKAWSPGLSLAQLWRAIPVLEPPPLCADSLRFLLQLRCSWPSSSAQSCSPYVS